VFGKPQNRQTFHLQVDVAHRRPFGSIWVRVRSFTGVPAMSSLRDHCVDSTRRGYVSPCQAVCQNDFLMVSNEIRLVSNTSRKSTWTARPMTIGRATMWFTKGRPWTTSSSWWSESAIMPVALGPFWNYCLI
jgi:hypothetical protein